MQVSWLKLQEKTAASSQIEAEASDAIEHRPCQRAKSGHLSYGLEHFIGTLDQIAHLRVRGLLALVVHAKIPDIGEHRDIPPL
ncbi:MAG TPA: hypothetical protein VGR40_00505, partial [Candidatus Binatus sp.]|nr:hypothetical protein [Candidatus Binatus sp.]